MTGVVFPAMWLLATLVLSGCMWVQARRLGYSRKRVMGSCGVAWLVGVVVTVGLSWIAGVVIGTGVFGYFGILGVWLAPFLAAAAGLWLQYVVGHNMCSERTVDGDPVVDSSPSGG